MTVLANADDADLLALSRRGNSGAMAELWMRHYPATLAAARRVSRQPKDAEEFASDAFSGMLQAIHNDAGPTQSVRAYLLTAVRNQATGRARRAAASDVLTDEITDFEEPDGDLVDPVAHHVELGLVREAFASLPHRWQSVLWRTVVDHDSNTTIAADLDMSANAVAALARRARQGFRTAYLQAHVSRDGIAAECEPYIARLVDLLSSSSSRRKRFGPRDVRQHVAQCEQCSDRLATLETADRELAGVLLPALLALGPGVAWATTTGVFSGHAAGVVAGWKLGLSPQHVRQITLGGAAAGVVAAGALAAYALTAPAHHQAAAAATHPANTSAPAAPAHSVAPPSAPTKSPSSAPRPAASPAAPPAPAAAPSSAKPSPASSTTPVARPTSAPPTKPAPPTTAPPAPRSPAPPTSPAAPTSPPPPTTPAPVPPGQSTPPGHGSTPPGQSPTPPGHGATPPGHRWTAPGQAKKSGAATAGSISPRQH